MRRTVHGGWQDSGGVRGRRNGRVCAACEQLGCGLVGVDLIMELEEPPFFFLKKNLPGRPTSESIGAKVLALLCLF